MTVVLGEMDVARAKPKTPAGRQITSANSNWDESFQPAAAANRPGAIRDRPLTQWTSTRPGLRRELENGGCHSRRTKRGIGYSPHVVCFV